MTDHPSTHNVWTEIEEQGERLASAAAQDVATYHETGGEGGYEHYDEALLELVSDVLDGHDWFARRHRGAEFHGAVLEHSLSKCDNDPSTYSDWEGLAQSDDMQTVVKRLAYFAFEAAVLDYATGQNPDDY